jgi:hypothetical protein
VGDEPFHADKTTTDRLRAANRQTGQKTPAQHKWEISGKQDPETQSSTYDKTDAEGQLSRKAMADGTKDDCCSSTTLLTCYLHKFSRPRTLPHPR